MLHEIQSSRANAVAERYRRGHQRDVGHRIGGDDRAHELRIVPQAEEKGHREHDGRRCHRPHRLTSFGDGEQRGQDGDRNADLRQVERVVREGRHDAERQYGQRHGTAQQENGPETGGEDEGQRARARVRCGAGERDERRECGNDCQRQSGVGPRTGLRECGVAVRVLLHG